MADAVDCSVMSRAACYEAGEPAGEPHAPATAPATATATATRSGELGAASLRDPSGRLLGHASYECVNDCVSSQGVAVLVGSAVASLGCLMVPLACPVFVGAEVGTVTGACEAACEELERP